MEVPGGGGGGSKEKSALHGGYYYFSNDTFSSIVHTQQLRQIDMFIVTVNFGPRSTP